MAVVSEADASLAAAELLRVDVFRHQEVPVGESRRAEGIKKQLAHVPRRQSRKSLEHGFRRLIRKWPRMGVKDLAVDGQRDLARTIRIRPLDRVDVHSVQYGFGY